MVLVMTFGNIIATCFKCRMPTSKGIGPWYQAWLFRLLPLSFSSSSSCFLSFSDGGSNQNWSLENLKGITGTQSDTKTQQIKEQTLEPSCGIFPIWVHKSQQRLLHFCGFLKCSSFARTRIVGSTEGGEVGGRTALAFPHWHQHWRHQGPKTQTRAGVLTRSLWQRRKQRKLLLSPDVNPGIIPAGFSPGLKALGVTTHGEQTLLIHVSKRGKQTSFSLTVKLHVGNVKLLGHSTLPQHAAYFHE
ncbi:hypothetical protein F7725_013281 [Dissostichus mawsoni]|uniref:Uncharacterized protein n=1 Tax=Dissostichus mawsoni TaxID=36200 RepID=A0A7J5YS36_DISMA|nr:hypothetical protein F7725_013281 [Dissostichus mawsoni]